MNSNDHTINALFMDSPILGEIHPESEESDQILNSIYNEWIRDQNEI
jgi:hypothetical protein